jgi:hypothetical protein
VAKDIAKNKGKVEKVMAAYKSGKLKTKKKEPVKKKKK